MNIPSPKERRLARKTEQIDFLLGLDMDPVARGDEEKAALVAEHLSYWENPPAVSTLKTWRKEPLYQERKEAVLGDEELTDRLKYWAQKRYLEDILPKYDHIIANPR